MKTRTHVRLVPLLIAEFPRWLDYFVEHGPFTRREQLDCHLKAIALRRSHTRAATAAEDPDFVMALYDTLGAWGLGSRGSRLRPLTEFGPALQAVSATLEPLESLSASPSAGRSQTARRTGSVVGGARPALEAGLALLRYANSPAAAPGSLKRLTGRSGCRQRLQWRSPQSGSGIGVPAGVPAHRTHRTRSVRAS